MKYILNNTAQGIELHWVTFDENGVHYSIYIPELVDLGLPSGTLWANRNIGARKETDYGLYFQWAGIEGYTAAQVTSGEKVFDFDSTPYQTTKGIGTNVGKEKFTKYFKVDASNKDSSVSNDIVTKKHLEPIDDAATQLIGSKWAMPTYEDIAELIKNTTNVWINNYNNSGKNGRLFTSKINGNTIFLPASGRLLGNDIMEVGEWCYIWENNHDLLGGSGEDLEFNKSRVLTASSRKCHGFNIRPVIRFYTPREVIFTAISNPKLMTFVYSVKHWAENPREMWDDQAASITTLSSTEFATADLVHFSEFKYFVNAVYDYDTTDSQEALFTSSSQGKWPNTTLLDLTIPNGMTDIGNMCYGCESLTSISIPNNVTNIGNNAFNDCKSLSSINYDGTIEQWNSITKGANWKYQVPSTCIVHCIDGDISISEA